MVKNLDNKITDFLDRKRNQYPELNKSVDTIIRELR